MGGSRLTPELHGGELRSPRPACQRSSYVRRGGDRLGWRGVAKLLIVSESTARRRLADWYTAPEHTAPRTELAPGDRRGRSAYTTTRAEIARHYPEIDDA